MQSKYNQLSEIQHIFKRDLGLSPIIGVELEFYLDSVVDTGILSGMMSRHFKRERGTNQFEVDFGPSDDLLALVQEVENFRVILQKQAQKLGGWASFEAKPYINDFGSAMHIHINFKEEFDLERCAQILCHRLDEYISCCLPLEDDILRLDHNFMAPTHVSWGGNNRSTMIRIPDSVPIRLEHRLPGANADPFLVVQRLLQTLFEGLVSVDKTLQIPRIYGNAFDKQYHLKLIRRL